MTFDLCGNCACC